MMTVKLKKKKTFFDQYYIFFRDIPSMGIYMLSYEHLCSMLVKRSYSETNKDHMPKHVQIISGGIAGTTNKKLNKSY